MFHRHPPTPSPAKHVIYCAASVMLGVLVSLLAHAGIELLMISRAEQQGAASSLVWYTVFGGAACALPPVVVYGLLLAGAFLGLFIGRIWWRMVYIEQRWSRNENNNNKQHGASP